jgi:hypothetical protein
MTALSPSSPRASRRASGNAVGADVPLHCGRARLLSLIAGCLAAALFLAVAAVGAADATRQQTVQLRKGWNAVFLEVAPQDPEPAKVFAGTPVDIAAAFSGPLTSAQFMTDPGANLFRLAGWSVWYADSRPDAFLKSLHAINGQQGYLIHAKDDFAWTVSGQVLPPLVRWQADAFNFVGFSVAPVSGPTFARFFESSPAHNHNRIYRLENGTWRQVANPAAEVMRSGEAFWIHCAGASTYQGPLQVETTSRTGVALGTAKDAVVLRNKTAHPVGVTMEHVVTTANPWCSRWATHSRRSSCCPRPCRTARGPSPCRRLRRARPSACRSNCGGKR